MNIIELKDISKIYGKHDYQTIALNHINLSIEKGEFLAIMGASGSGKSTFLNILGCIDVPTSGEYYLNDVLTNSKSEKELSNIRNYTVSFIFQNFALLNDYSLYDNIELPLLHRKISARQKKEKIMHYASRLGINDILRKKPHETSGGQQQRAAIARALVCESEIILADEPTGALDQKTGEDLLQLLKQINQEGKTILVVTHDSKTANYASKIITINDGRII